MPRQVAASIENNFIKGLITQGTELSFPEDGCTETFNCVFGLTGRVTRRLGIDFEAGYGLVGFFIGPSADPQAAYTEYTWNSPGGSGDRKFLLIQRGNHVKFFDISNSVTPSANPNLVFEVRLTDYLPTGSAQNPSLYPCRYASSSDTLIIVNRFTNPILVKFDPALSNVAVSPAHVKYRDFTGLEDALGITGRPTSDVPTLKTARPEHFYNINNQGWYIADALAQWDAARTDLPSNADSVPMYRLSETDAFDSARVDANNPGNTPAPNGHFILEVGNPDRNGAMVAEGLTGSSLGATTSVLLSGTAIPGTFAFPNRAFDGATNTPAVGCATSNVNLDMLGKNVQGTPYQIASATVYGSNNLGFIQTTNGSVIMQLRGKNGSFPTQGSGSLLGTISFTDTNNESAGRTINSSDTATFWDYLWIEIATDGPIAIAEIKFNVLVPVAGGGGITNVTEPLTTERFQATAFFAGRAWYAGINASTWGSKIYFTQIIQGLDQFSACYQQNDPTSETLADLLPSDGGVIQIPDMGLVRSLFTYQSNLMVFASNGVWLIGGTNNGAFQANDFLVRKISSIGMNAPQSIVDVRGVPMWWAEDGIYALQYDANYNSFSVSNHSQATVWQFFLDIPVFNRQFVKVAYDVLNNVVYWLFNDSDFLGPEDTYRYTKVLALNAFTGAYYPWVISDSPVRVHGISYVVDANHNLEPAIKFFVAIDNGANLIATFAEANNTNYVDWERYSVDIAVDTAQKKDYTSYFITGFKLHGQTQRNFQSNYLFGFMEQEDNASCFVNSIFDFTTTGDSGRWSTIQQVYKEPLESTVSMRRLKLRGHGRALQFKFQSESGKPFTVIGWSVYETGNQGI